MLHQACVASPEVFNETAWLPLAIQNSPYGGNSSVFSSVPFGLYGTPPDVPPSVHGSESNGTIGGGLWKVNLSISPLASEYVWGPGTNAQCPGPFQVNIESVSPGHLYTGGFFLWPWGPQFGPNSSSDAGEPLQFNMSLTQGDSTVLFHNGFVTTNHATISTCGVSTKVVPVRSSFLDVWIPFESGGRAYSPVVTLPFAESFSYTFPANFGTWQIDNLSAPGGPGGGWAFSYSPCP